MFKIIPSNNSLENYKSYPTISLEQNIIKILTNETI